MKIGTVVAICQCGRSNSSYRHSRISWPLWVQFAVRNIPSTRLHSGMSYSQPCAEDRHTSFRVWRMFRPHCRNFRLIWIVFGAVDLRRGTLGSGECHEIGAMEVAPYWEVSCPVLSCPFNIYCPILRVSIQKIWTYLRVSCILAKGKPYFSYRGINQITFTHVAWNCVASTQQRRLPNVCIVPHRIRYLRCY